MDDSLLEARKQTHGAYKEYAAAEQALRSFLRGQPSWHKMSAVQQSVLDNVVGKMARILTGSPNHIDHWRDLAGYGQRAIEELSEKQGATDTETIQVTFVGGAWQ